MTRTWTPDDILPSNRGRGRPTIPEYQGEPLDLIVGTRAIAAALGVTKRKVDYWHDLGLLPTFKMRGTVCARRSELDAALRKKPSNGEGE